MVCHLLPSPHPPPGMFKRINMVCHLLKHIYNTATLYNGQVGFNKNMTILPLQTDIKLSHLTHIYDK